MTYFSGIISIKKDSKTLYKNKEFCKLKGEKHSNKNSVTRDINYKHEVIKK